jgi:hypothetical protein
VRYTVEIKRSAEREAKAVNKRGQPPDYWKGHGERLRLRFRRGGESTLHDYELLKRLLTFAIPRRDTKAAAQSRSGTA